MNNTITITQKEYNELLESQRSLEALQCAGVDNWSGYCEAQEIFNSED
jgi:hypothetical protein